MKNFLKVTIASFALSTLLALNVSAEETSYNIAETVDTYPSIAQTIDTKLSNGASIEPLAVDLYHYDGNFSHIIYSASSVNATSGQTYYVKGKQQSTNSSYPDLYVQYTFVNKGTNANNPDDDILLTGTTTNNNGSYTTAGEYNLSFYINSQAQNTKAHLRAWNLNNSSGSNDNKTVHIWGTVSK